MKYTFTDEDMTRYLHEEWGGPRKVGLPDFARWLEREGQAEPGEAEPRPVEPLDVYYDEDAGVYYVVAEPSIASFRRTGVPGAEWRCLFMGRQPEGAAICGRRVEELQDLRFVGRLPDLLSAEKPEKASTKRYFQCPTCGGAVGVSFQEGRVAPFTITVPDAPRNP